MRILRVLFALTLLTFLPFNLEEVKADSNNEYIVALEDNVGLEKASEVAKGHGLEVIQELMLSHVVVVRGSQVKVEKLLELDFVKYVEPNYTATMNPKPENPGKPPKDEEPDDPPPPQDPQITPWGITRVNAPQVWNQGITGSNIKVAVLDTGIDLDHPDLNIKRNNGINLINTRKSFNDDNGHGTHVAGTIAALNNDLGVVGVAPDVTLYGVKVLDRKGSGSYAGIAEGIRWAVREQVDIINMSLSGDYPSQTLHDAVIEAYNAGVIVVCAASNDGHLSIPDVDYPARYNETIAVGATDSNNLMAYFSSYGPGYYVDIVAPGVDILSTVPDGGYDAFNGTSMASPHVAGVIALLFDAQGEQTLEQIRTKLATNSTDINYNDSYLGPGQDIKSGHGLIDAYNLIY
jgi:subtilisin family serine protease